MKNTLIHFMIALVVAAITLGGYILWYSYVKQLDTDTASLESDIAAKEADRVRTNAARSAEGDLLAQESFVASHFVQTVNIVSFLEKLDTAGKEFDAVVHVASVSGEEKSSNGRIILSLSITGSFDAVMRTLGVIEHGPYANMVSDLTLNTTDGTLWAATGTFVVGAAIATKSP